MRIAVLLTVFNRVDKTVKCLDRLFNSFVNVANLDVEVYITNDGSTDSTKEVLKEKYSSKKLHVLEGDGTLYWNGGMNNSWQAALQEGGYDGFLWLNNDSYVYSNLWKEIIDTHNYSLSKFEKGGIYVGSTKDAKLGEFTYGGFIYTNKWTLKDKFLKPNGCFQLCQAAHGNITFVAVDVVKSEGIFCSDYIHSGGDHDYSYLAFKHGFPVIVMREYVGECENDHSGSYGSEFKAMSLKERIKYLKSPLGYNLNNTLLFQKRCFPYRYIPVLLTGYFKALFPNFYFYIYKKMRS